MYGQVPGSSLGCVSEWTYNLSLSLFSLSLPVYVSAYRSIKYQKNINYFFMFRCFPAMYRPGPLPASRTGTQTSGILIHDCIVIMISLRHWIILKIIVIQYEIIWAIPTLKIWEESDLTFLYRSSKHCAAIKSTVFSACHSRIQPDFYFKACRIDMCECPGTQCHCEVTMPTHSLLANHLLTHSVA